LRITVQYLTQLKQAAGRQTESVELPENADIAQLLDVVADKHSARMRQLLFSSDGSVLPAILIFVNDQQVRLRGFNPLREGDDVTLLSPIAGG